MNKFFTKVNYSLLGGSEICFRKYLDAKILTYDPKRVPKSLNQDLIICWNLIDKPKVVSQSQKLTTWFS